MLVDWCDRCNRVHETGKHDRRAESHPPAAFFKAARIVITARRALWRLDSELDYLAWEAKHGHPPTGLKEIFSCHYARKIHLLWSKSNALTNLIRFEKTAMLGQPYDVPIKLG